MKCLLPDESATRDFAARLATVVGPGLCIHLSGDLGAGKTTLVRCLLQALGHTGLVKSPTYGLVEFYELPNLTVCHADLYRLGHPDELELLGVRDWLQVRPLLLVEWPQRGVGVLPPADLSLDLAHAGGASRQLEITAGSPLGEQLLARFSSQLCVENQ